MIKLKRAYEPPAKADGHRILVDRLWPRGVTKEDLRIEAWARDVAPSATLRKWFGHDPSRWQEFRTRYFKELDGKRDAVDAVFAGLRGTVTLVFAAKDTEHNQALVLKDYLARHMR
jgi:uncharacterized protein YeaO (DUF488 family)